MVVAKSQIGEILDILFEEVPVVTTRKVIKRLKKTKAYEKNKSFRETIDQLERGL